MYLINALAFRLFGTDAGDLTIDVLFLCVTVVLVYVARCAWRTEDWIARIATALFCWRVTR